MKHFEFRMIPGGYWRRIKGTTPGGMDLIERPHFVPLTERGRRYLAIDASRLVGSSGLCPGEIRVEGQWVQAYRFIEISEEAVADMLPTLNEEVDRYMDHLHRNSQENI
ncbi:MAG: hypothetical protein ACYS7Y_11960 [Planctomycetota bacterium]|jgi:hypothetical protein